MTNMKGQGVDFDSLHQHIPYVTGGKVKKHSQTLPLETSGKWAVRVRQPGKYWEKSTPPGGDMVVEVSCNTAGWKWKQFRHDHLFKDIELKLEDYGKFMRDEFAPALARVVYSKTDPRLELLGSIVPVEVPGLSPEATLFASQALALAEHRRYKRFESRGGGRLLPARFAVGVIFKTWPSEAAAGVMYQGLPGLESLIAQYGKPPTLKELV